jgi:hypothetical protein
MYWQHKLVNSNKLSILERRQASAIGNPWPRCRSCILDAKICRSVVSDHTPKFVSADNTNLVPSHLCETMFGSEP